MPCVDFYEVGQCAPWMTSPRNTAKTLVLASGSVRTAYREVCRAMGCALVIAPPSRIRLDLDHQRPTLNIRQKAPPAHVACASMAAAETHKVLVTREDP